jgi:ABC-type branched-subunit amino acid transport system substrate-binding protein
MVELSGAGGWVRALVSIGLALGAVVAPGVAEPPGLSPAEERGRVIYFEGSAPSGDPITAYLGENRLELPGEAATCGSCHGHDGKGRPESGILPSNVTWKYLTRSYGHLHPGGLEHSRFDEESLEVYMRTGVYPGGERGDPSMPVYEISDRDLDDLLAYMKLVGEILDPGLGETTVRVGTLLPSGGPLGEIGDVIRDVLQACFEEVNQTGGVYGRRLELAVHRIRAAEEARPEAVGEWLAEERPFALVSPFTPRMDLAVHAAVSSRGIPLVGPFTLHSVQSFALNRNVFYLYPGLGEQVEALLRYADRELELASPRLAVLHPSESSLDDVLALVEKSGREREWPSVRREVFAAAAFDAARSVEALRQAAVDLVVFLGVESELRLFLEAAATADWFPHVLAPGALAGGLLAEVPSGFEERLYLAYPTLPQDRKPWALREVSRLLGGNQLARSHVQAVLSAYSSAAVLVEALRRAGKDLGRRELTTELEGLYRFETGLTPPITFTANRRVGAQGAYVLGPASVAEGRLPETVDWVEVE